MTQDVIPQKVVLDFATAIDPVRLAQALVTYVPLYGSLELVEYHENIDVSILDSAGGHLIDESFDLFGDDARTHDVISIICGNLGLEGQEDIVHPNNLAASIRLLKKARERGLVRIVPSNAFVDGGIYNEHDRRLRSLVGLDHYPNVKIQGKGRTFLVGPDDSYNDLISDLALVASGEYSAIFSTDTIRKKCEKYLFDDKCLQPIEGRTGIIRRQLQRLANPNPLSVDAIFQLLEKGFSINETISLVESEITRAGQIEEIDDLKSEVVLFWPKFLLDQVTFGAAGVIEWFYQLYQYLRKRRNGE